MESMRGLAALWVFLFHISAIVQTSLPSAFALASNGFRGVTMFFVISGYCIFAAAQKTAAAESLDNMRFLKRRLLRIFPPFWASIIIVLMLPYIVEMLAAIKSGNYLHPHPSWLEYSLVDWISIGTLSKDIVDAGGQLKAGYSLINSVYWTLGIEVQFYLIVFISLLFKTYWKLALTTVTLISLLPIDSSHLPNGLFLPFWPAFALGIGLRLLHTHHLVPARIFGRSFFAMSFFGALVTVFLVTFFSSKDLNVSFTVAAALSAAFLWCLGGIEYALQRKSYFSPILTKWLKRALIPVIMLGQSSYSLYLLHGKLYHLPEMFIRQIIRLDSGFYLLLVVILTAVICYGFYVLIERPFQRYRFSVESQVSKALKIRTI